MLILSIAFLSYIGLPLAQPPLPQRSITVTSTQGIHFGTFCLVGTAGGTITVGYDGSRSSTGGILLLPKPPTAHPAIFEIKLCEGRLVTINYDVVTTLDGSKGGSLSLNLGPTEKGLNGSNFAINSDCNFITPLRVGGTLQVLGTASPGSYNGNIAVTFNRQ